MSKDDPFEISSFIQIVRNKQLNEKLLSPLNHLLGFKSLSKLYNEITTQKTQKVFIPTLLNKLDIKYKVVSCTLELSKDKPLIIVSNHPFGAIEALMLLDYFSEFRPDIRVMANVFLKRIVAISDQLMGVNPFKNNLAKKANHCVMKKIFNWVKSSHCLITFPAGNVSHFRLNKMTVSDPNWDQQIAKLARATNADVLPIFIEGRNSLWFYCLGPKLHAFRYGNELLNKRHKTFFIHIGQLITRKQIKEITSDKDLINHFRSKSEELKP